MVTLCQLVWVSVLSSASTNSKKHCESLVEQRRQVQVEMEEMWGGLKDASRVRSGAGEGEIVRWAAFLSAEVMAEW